ncbi:hypothetical protein TrispH2_002496 [Trichoplax sp. H2]|nr:hypothetical protein TrispH2_002496 [Trichoplax sp. H2]|eukprot:RDD45216.1 hypothetical protein TrispH2_002496 [Trichoplax sp. H2]
MIYILLEDVTAKAFMFTDNFNQNYYIVKVYWDYRRLYYVYMCDNGQVLVCPGFDWITEEILELSIRWHQAFQPIKLMLTALTLPNKLSLLICRNLLPLNELNLVNNEKSNHAGMAYSNTLATNEEMWISSAWLTSE